jgi:peptidyl-prolyl cis-trans isomerase C
MRPRLLVPVIVLAASGIGYAQNQNSGVSTPGSPAEVAATVNGEAITVAELDAALKANLPSVPLTAADRRQLRAALLNDLIDDKFLKQFLAKHGPKVDPAEIEAQMTALKASLVRENRTLADFLKQTGQTEAQLRDFWATQIQLANYVKQHATDDKLRAYHAANRDHFDKVEVRVSHVVIRVGKSATPVERAAAKEKLQAVRADLAAGKTTFAAAAKKFSQCPSALKGGDLGFVPRRGLPEDEPLAKAAFALKVGGLSEVVETDYGVHLLTVTDRKPGTPSVLEKCVVEVLEAYTEDYRVELVAKLRKEGQVKVMLP